MDKKSEGLIADLAGLKLELDTLKAKGVNTLRPSKTNCGFHDTWTLSPRSFGHSFHAHLDT